MNKLALQLPGMNVSIPCVGGNRFCQNAETSSLGYILSQFFSLALMAAAFIVFIWFVWAAFEYIFAGGAKEGMARARKRITYSIIGFILITLAYAASAYAQSLFPQVNNFYNNKAIPTLPPVPDSPVGKKP